MVQPSTLQQWYRHVNSVYLDRNFYRTPESIFMHLVEVFGGLSLVASGKKKAGVVADEFLAKSVGWWMALCGKVGVRDVESLIWTKFPYVCPYCQEMPHVAEKCTSVRRENASPDWEKLRKIGKENSSRRPSNVQNWQRMFQEIYPRFDQTTHEINFSRLAEEFGELAEGIRVLPIARTYFLSEVTDVFAWLMGEANQMRADRGYGSYTLLENALRTEYPETCRYCGSRLCKCPPILQTTLGRLAHDTPASAFAEEGGGVLFTVEEAQGFFRVGDEAIRLGNQQVSVNAEIITEVHDILEKLAKKHEELQLGPRLDEALAWLETLASQQKITQDSVNAIFEAINALPSEKRNMLLGFLSNVSAGAFLEAFLRALGT